MADNIVLIGFMGVGKGRVGRALAGCTGRFVVDCDDLIESAMNMKVKKIFSFHGEQAFREKERQVALWLEKSVHHTIVSTGGGFVNVPNLAAIGKVVHLYDEFDKILHRLTTHTNAEKKIKKRPLLRDMKKAKKLYEKRLPLYREAADFTIDIQGRKPEQTAEALAGMLGLGRVDG